VAAAPAGAEDDGMSAHAVPTPSAPEASRRRPRLMPALPTLALDAAYLVVALPLGILTFTVAVTGLALAAGLAITLVGLPVLIATLWAARLLGDAERRRAGWVLGEAVPRRRRPWTGATLWERVKASIGDGGAWRDLSWGVLLLPIGTAGFTIAVSAWSTALAFVTSPLWYWALNEEHDTVWLLDSHAAGASALRVLIGLALVPVAAWICRGAAEGSARAARAILR
jgi:putative sensor protein